MSARPYGHYSRIRYLRTVVEQGFWKTQRPECFFGGGSNQSYRALVGFGGQGLGRAAVGLASKLSPHLHKHTSTCAKS